MTKKDVASLLMMIALTFPNSKIPTDKDNLADLVTAWHFFLAEKDASGINLALKSYVETHSSAFAPSVSELIEEYHKIIEKTTEDEIGEMQAWKLCYDAICNSGGDYHNSEREFAKLPKIIQDTVGHPGNLREMAIDERFNEGVERSNFLRNYKTQLVRKAEERRTLPEIRTMIESRREQSLVPEFDTPLSIEGKTAAENDGDRTCEDSEENHQKVREMLEKMRNDGK